MKADRAHERFARKTPRRNAPLVPQGAKSQVNASDERDIRPGKAQPEGTTRHRPTRKRNKPDPKPRPRVKPAPSVVDITPLKRLATQRLRQSSPLREVLLSEPDEMPVAEYLVKISIWQRLLNMETA